MFSRVNHKENLFALTNVCNSIFFFLTFSFFFLNFFFQWNKNKNLRGKLMEKPLKGLLPKTLYLCSNPTKNYFFLCFIYFLYFILPLFLVKKKLRNEEEKKKKTANFKECYWKNIKQINYIVMCISIDVEKIQYTYTHKEIKKNFLVIVRRRNFFLIVCLFFHFSFILLGMKSVKRKEKFKHCELALKSSIKLKINTNFTREYY